MMMHVHLIAIVHRTIFVENIAKHSNNNVERIFFLHKIEKE